MMTDNKGTAVTNFGGVVIALVFLVIGAACCWYILAGHSGLNNWTLLLVCGVVILGIWRILNRIPIAILSGGELRIFAFPRLFTLSERGRVEVHPATRREKAVFLGLPLPMNGYTITVFRDNKYEEFVVYCAEGSAVGEALLEINEGQ
ncbi:MAG: hypothetical protein GY771_04455 [bacterium]|nr:hypothetical protein [bacterium]